MWETIDLVVWRFTNETMIIHWTNLANLILVSMSIALSCGALSLLNYNLVHWNFLPFLQLVGIIWPPMAFLFDMLGFVSLPINEVYPFWFTIYLQFCRWLKQFPIIINISHTLFTCNDVLLVVKGGIHLHPYYGNF